MNKSHVPRRLKILLVGELLPRVMRTLKESHDVAELWTVADQATYLEAFGSTIEVLATSGAYGANATLISALPNLKLIASFGVGTDPIDLVAAHARGIAVTNTPGVLNGCVADYAVGLLLAIARRIVQADRFVRDGQWLTQRLQFGTKLGGKLCGIVGMGGVGREIATRVQACGMRVAYHGPHPKPELNFDYYSSLVSLAYDADVLVLSLPGGTDTRHIVDAEVLRALGPNGLLVNIARGSVVDEAALVEALQSGTIGGAALDVFEGEPLVPQTLVGCGNVVLSPHTASGTFETRNAMADLMLANIAAYESGIALLTPVL
jgi:hydroxypyruvate reductase